MARGLSLHVGVNNVDPGVYGSPLTLRGCENDARSMRAIARAAGFDPAAPDILLSRDATAQNVANAIRAAAASLGQDDIFFLTYSGHGGQVPDPAGDEDDARDETWVLYDRQLIDDELHALWARFPTGCRILVLSDSCHSGTVIKDVASGELYDATREATLQALPILAREMVGFDATEFRTKDLPFLVQAEVYLRNKKLYDGLPRARDITPAASIILISGCQDNQVSLDGVTNGLFTEKLLTVWDDGSFIGDHEAFCRAIGRLLPNTQSPNFFTAGTPDPRFQRQRPLTVSPPAAPSVPTQPAGSWLDRLRLGLDNLWKEHDMTSGTRDTDGAQEKWLEFIPIAVNLGMQVVDALTKEGFQLQDSKGVPVAATKDAEGEKWIQFIPLAISLGTQVYGALSKEGALPADKQVNLPKDFSPERTKDWLDLIPVAIDLGTQVFTALTKEGYVSSGVNLPQVPKLDDPAAKGWLDLIPVALKIGSQVYDTLTKETGAVPTMATTSAEGTTTVATKEVVGSFSQKVLGAVNA